MVAEVLKQLISRAEKLNLIEGLQIGLDAINISYLQFANDTILLCPTRYEALVNYRRILDCFGVMSGLQINYDKSIVIPIHYDRVWVYKVKSVLGCSKVSLPLQYLGNTLGG